MNKHLFLIADDINACMDSIISVLGERLAYSGGFFTSIYNNIDSDCCEYYLQPAATSVYPRDYQRSLFLSIIGSKIEKDNEIIRSSGTSMLSETQYYPYVLLGGFGGIDLLIPQFRAELAEVLSSELPVIGIVYSKTEQQRFKALFGLGNKYDMLYDNLLRVLEADSDSTTAPFDSSASDAACLLVEKWAKSYLKC